jgi:hypothetical protein
MRTASPRLTPARLCFGIVVGFLLGGWIMTMPTVALTVIFLTWFVWRRIRPALRGADRRIDDILTGEPMTTEQAKAAIAAHERRVTELERLVVWRRARHHQLPGWTPRLALERDFTAYTDCEFGHYDFHGLGETFTDWDERRIVRTCVADGCTSTWTERA